MPVMQALTKNGAIAALMSAGASIRPCFCVPLAPETVPANGAFSIRHSTRNFPQPRRFKPSDGQVSYVPDGRPVRAATALERRCFCRRHGTGLCSADTAEELYRIDDSSYKARFYGTGKPKATQN